MPDIVMTRLRRCRLREFYRSAGRPCLDTVEIERLAAALLERVRGPLGHETLRVTDAGLALVAETMQRNRAQRSAHERLVERLARAMTPPRARSMSRARRRCAMQMPFGLWMALAQATPLPGWRLEGAQGQLGDTASFPPES